MPDTTEQKDVWAGPEWYRFSDFRLKVVGGMPASSLEEGAMNSSS